MKPFCFTSPLDLMLMCFATLAEAESAARGYIGDEDFWTETVTEVQIYRMDLVSTVKEPMPDRIEHQVDAAHKHDSERCGKGGE